MSKYVKYPKTMHLPWSPSKTEDQTIESMDAFIGQRVIITEKMDGECTTMYNDHIHARSLDSKNHPSRNWVKNFWGQLKDRIPKNIRICGENVYATHSIHYTNLNSYFLGFSVWNCKECLSWDETDKLFDELQIISVPVWYDGIYDEKVFQKIQQRVETQNSEGYVIRVANNFKATDFNKKVAKFVRKNHVQTDEHWMHRNDFEKNILTQK